jgi:hypothetical protein
VLFRSDLYTYFFHESWRKKQIDINEDDVEKALEVLLDNNFIYKAADSAPCFESPIDLIETVCSIWLNCDLFGRPAQRI